VEQTDSARMVLQPPMGAAVWLAVVAENLRQMDHE